MKPWIVSLFTLVIVAGAAIMWNKNLKAEMFPVERSFNVSYSAAIQDLPQKAQLVKVWIPLASSRGGQEIINRTIQAPGEYKITQDKKFGNEMLYFEAKKEKFSNLEFTINYETKVNREEFIRSAKEENLKPYLNPSRLMVVNEEVKQRALKAVANKKEGFEKARGIFDYVIDHMDYDKQTPGYGKGDTIRACDIGKGNCTDFHSLFISMALAENIPARFKIGLPIPETVEEGQIKGYHCWAEYYDAKQGWRQVDASEAWKKPEKRDLYFGGIDTSKFLISVGRDVSLNPSQEGGDVNIFFYPYVEVDGEPFNDVKTKFSFKNRKQ